MPDPAGRRHLVAVPADAPADEPVLGLAELSGAVAAPLREIAELAGMTLAVPGACVLLAEQAGAFAHGTVAEDDDAVAEQCRRVMTARETIAAGTFAGTPVLLPDGHVVACLAVVAAAARSWAPTDLRLLASLADRAATEIRLAIAEAQADEADPLTGLIGRAAFLGHVDEAIAEHDATSALLHIEVDDFAHVRAAFGADAGDALLVQVAERLRGALRPTDLAGHMGGSSFTVLCRGMPNEAATQRIAERARETLLAPFAVDGRERSVEVTVSCRMVEEGDGTLPEIDLTGYRGVPVHDVTAFTEKIRDDLLRSLQVEDELRDAIENGELLLHYQPMVSLIDGLVEGAEALVRWEHPTAGLLAPAEFLPVAEESALIDALGRWTIEETLRQATAWRVGGLSPMRISINLSPLQLAEPGLADLVLAAASRHGVALESLCLEVTEGALMGPGPAMDTLWALRDAGAYVAVDDFGTGFSSLAALKQLPVDVLKIDRRFVKGLGADPDDSAIVAAIMSLGAAMGIQVMAEGVETAEQALELRALGCALAQGFLFAPAVPAGDLAELARGGSLYPPHPGDPLHETLADSRSLDRLSGPQ